MQSLNSISPNPSEKYTSATTILLLSDFTVAVIVDMLSNILLIQFYLVSFFSRVRPSKEQGKQLKNRRNASFLIID
jgi:hypothetical protein